MRLYKKDRQSKLRLFYTSDLHKCNISALIISPDETLLVTTDAQELLLGSKEDKASFVHDIKTKKKIHDIDTSVYVNKWSLVSRKNKLVTRKSGYKTGGTLAVLDLREGKIVHEVVVNDTYKLDMVQLHACEDYVFVGYSDTGILNGIRNKYAELVNVESGEQYGRCPDAYKGPYAVGQVFGSESLYYALCHWNKCELAIFFAGI